MKPHLLLCSLLTIFLTPICHAITADELAGFLDISSWETQIPAPANSISVELLEIKDGKTGKQILTGHNDSSNQPPITRVVIFIKPTDSGFSGSLSLNGSTLTLRDYKTPQFKSFISKPLPKTAELGDYLLFGDVDPQDGVISITNDISHVKQGFLLRITKKS